MAALESRRRWEQDAKPRHSFSDREKYGLLAFLLEKKLLLSKTIADRTKEMDQLEKEFREAYAKGDNDRVVGFIVELGLVRYVQLAFSCCCEEMRELNKKINEREKKKRRQWIWESDPVNKEPATPNKKELAATESTIREPLAQTKERSFEAEAKTSISGLSRSRKGLGLTTSNVERSNCIFRPQMKPLAEKSAAELGFRSLSKQLDDTDDESETSTSELTPLFSNDSCYESSIASVGLKRRPQRSNANYVAI